MVKEIHNEEDMPFDKSTVWNQGGASKSGELMKKRTGDIKIKNL